MAIIIYFILLIPIILSLNMKIRKFHNKTIISIRLKIIMFKIKTYLALGNHNTKGKILYK